MRWVTVTMLIGLILGWVAEAYGDEPGLQREYAEFRLRLTRCAEERGMNVGDVLLAFPASPTDAEIRELRVALVRQHAACQDRPIPAAATTSFVRENPFNDPPPPVPPAVPVVHGQVNHVIVEESGESADQYEVHNTSFNVSGRCWLRVSVDGVVVHWAGARSPNDRADRAIPPEQVGEYLPPGTVGYIAADAGAHDLTYSCHPVRSRAGVSVVDDSRTLRYGSSRASVGRITPGELGGGAQWVSR